MQDRKIGFALLYRGFTLTELMVAAAILIVAILSLLAALINTMLLDESNNNLVIAVNDAQCVLEQIKGLSYSQISGYTPPTFNNLNNETVSLSLSPGTKITQVAVDVSWIERSRNRNFQLSTYFAQ